MRPETFAAITRRDRFHDVVAGLAAAQEAGLGPVKVNAVLMRGVNDDQAPELLDWCLERGYELRFIEQMPLDAQHGWTREGMITADEILAMRSRSHDLTPAAEPRGSAPAELFAVDGGPATVGIIASVTRPFCGDCDRVRLTADGQVRNCLFARDESDLRAALRAGADRRGDRRPLGDRDGRQAARPRHRRPDVPAARPADVGHRRLTRPHVPRCGGRLRRRAPRRPARRRAGTTARRGSRRASPVLVAGQPDLAPLGRVQLGVVPQQAPHRDGGQPLAEQVGSSRVSRRTWA